MSVATPPVWSDPTSATLDVATGSIWTQAAIDGTMSDLACLGGADGSLGWAAKLNQLINGGFEVWQRGTSGFTANLAYSADRWLINLAGSSTVTVSRDSTNFDTGSQYAMSCVYVHNAASYISQRLENFVQYRSVPMTFRCRVKTTTANAARIAIYDGAMTTFSAYHSGGGTYETLTVTATPAGAAANVDVQLRMDASATIFWDNATLVTGNAPMPYSPLPPDMELARCQRYYEIVGVAASSAVIVAGIATAGSQTAYATIPFKATKAVSPTITLSGTFTLTNASGQPTKLAADTTAVVLQLNNTSAGVFSAIANGAGSAIVAEANP